MTKVAINDAVLSNPDCYDRRSIERVVGISESGTVFYAEGARIYKLNDTPIIVGKFVRCLWWWRFKQVNGVY